METNDETRLRRLRALCVEHGGVKAVAEAAGLKWPNLDQVLKGTLLPERADGVRRPKSLGDESARAIEKAYDLGHGWFDWPFDAVDFKAYAKLNPIDQGYVQARMMAAIEERLPPSVRAQLMQTITGPAVSDAHVAKHLPLPPGKATAEYNRLKTQPRQSKVAPRRRSA
jgi:hypothetical protein